MSNMEDHDEKAYREDKIRKRRLILDNKNIIAQAGTRLYHRKIKRPTSEDEEIVNDHIKQCSIPKIMKDLRKHTKRIFDLYILKKKRVIFPEDSQPLRFSQKHAILWKKYQRTRAI